MSLGNTVDTHILRYNDKVFANGKIYVFDEEYCNLEKETYNIRLLEWPLPPKGQLIFIEHISTKDVKKISEEEYPEYFI